MSGIRTIEDLRLRCYCNDVTGCWQWRGSKDGGQPQMLLPKSDGSRRKSRGRNAALCLSRGVDSLTTGHVAYATAECRSPDCVNPKHCTSGTTAEWGVAMAKRGDFVGNPKRAAASRATGAKRSKLTSDQVCDIRSSDEPASVLAARHGVGRTTVRHVRLHKRYKSTINGASVFGWQP